jgi:hypothetical protein
MAPPTIFLFSFFFFFGYFFWLLNKKTSGEGHYNFIFFLNHVLSKTGRTLLRGEPIAFSYIYI